MFARIIAAILSFLMWIFPIFAPTEYDQEKKFYTEQTIADTVMAPIKAQDAEAFEAMICKNIKDNVPDLAEQIETLFQLMDGVTSYTVRGGAMYEANRGPNRIFKRDADIRFQISGVNLSLFIVWEVNNFSPAEKGIRHVSLWNMDTEESLVYFVSTEGFLYWHD